MMAKADKQAITAVILFGAAVFVYRWYYVEPRIWGSICAATTAPWQCVPRAGLLLGQRWQLWGYGALTLGALGFWGVGGRWVQAAAMGIGIAAILNYNATWGGVGFALALLGWVSPRRHIAGV